LPWGWSGGATRHSAGEHRLQLDSRTASKGDPPE
jgi:hypothetical protein